MGVKTSAPSEDKEIDPNGLMVFLGFDWTWDGVKEGFKTGVNGLASGMTFGWYDGGDYKNDIGFDVSQTNGKIATTCIASAIAVGAVGAIAGGGSAAGASAASSPVIIGETMKRVNVFASKIADVETYTGGVPGPAKDNPFLPNISENFKWIYQAVKADHSQPNIRSIFAT